MHRASTFMILVIQAYDFRHVLESAMGLSPTVDKGIWLEKGGVGLLFCYLGVGRSMLGKNRYNIHAVVVLR